MVVERRSRRYVPVLPTRVSRLDLERRAGTQARGGFAAGHHHAQFAGRADPGYVAMPETISCDNSMTTRRA